MKKQRAAKREARPRPQLAWFAERMEEQLRNNDHKGGWLDCEVDWLLDRAEEEIDELRSAIKGEGSTPTREDSIDEAADAANFLMMVADKIRRDCNGRISHAR